MNGASWEILLGALIAGAGICVTVLLRAFDHSLRHEGRLSVLEVSHRELVERLTRSEVEAAAWRERMDATQLRQTELLTRIREDIGMVRGKTEIARRNAGQSEV